MGKHRSILERKIDELIKEKKMRPEKKRLILEHVAQMASNGLLTQSQYRALFSGKSFHHLLWFGGNFFKRWKHRIILCTISINLWVGKIQGRLFSDAEGVARHVGEGEEAAFLDKVMGVFAGVPLIKENRIFRKLENLTDQMFEDTNSLLVVLRIVSWALLIASILWAIQILYSFAMLRADHKINRQGKNSLSVWIAIAVVNISILILLSHYVWNPWEDGYFQWYKR